MYNNMCIYIYAYMYVDIYLCNLFPVYIYICLNQTIHNVFKSSLILPQKKNGVKGASFPGSCGAHALGLRSQAVVKGWMNGSLPMR